MNRMLELLLLISTCDQIEGRKKLQKTVHILKCMGYPFDYRYSFHFHGPFSAELKDEIDMLVDLDLVNETEISKSSYRVFNYAASDSAEEILVSCGIPKEVEWAEMAKKLVSSPARNLEAMSTIFYLQNLNHLDEELRNEFVRLKPRLENIFDDSLSRIAKLQSN